jgi:hypothetical protein
MATKVTTSRFTGFRAPLRAFARSLHIGAPLRAFARSLHIGAPLPSIPLARSITGALLCGALIGLVSTSATVALAQSTDETAAAAANEKGKERLFANDFAGASAQFRTAAAASTLPKYSFNLCTSLFQQGLFSEAMAACKEARARNPDAKLSDKITAQEQKIKAEATAQGYSLDPAPVTPPPVDPTNPNPPGPTPPTVAPVVGRPPEVPTTAAKMEHKYQWSLGAQAVALTGNLVRSTNDVKSSLSGGGLRLLGDYVIAQGLGAQLRIDLLGVSAERRFVDAKTRSLVNVGIAGYKHIPLNRLLLTPYLGAHVYDLENAGLETIGDKNLAGFGAFAGASLGYAIGGRGEHLVHANADFTFDFTGYVGTDTANPSSDVSLRYLAFGIGYTYRFDTPLAVGGGSLFQVE